MVVDVDTERPLMSEIVAAGDEGYADECMLPRAAAARASTGRLYVACRGIDEMLELDASALDPMRVVLRRLGISKGVTGMAVADKEGLAVSFGEFDGDLDIVHLSDGERTVVHLGAAAPRVSASYQQGRELFFKTNDARITGDGVGCASCHPDGLDDGLTWSTPEGPRQTPMLAGRVHGTAPYGWTRQKATLPEYIADTVQRLGGKGVSQSELVALASYLERMDVPPPPVNGDDVSEGLKVFRASGCSECHAEAGGTDHLPHEVVPGSIEPFDTPSLRLVGLTAPYFHDGRYPTLDAVLTDPSSEMRAKVELSATQRTALIHYLESL
jgi:mono/diheme cytochrome c family protein